MSRIEKREQGYYLLCGQRHEKIEGIKMKLCWRRTSQRRKQPDQGLEEMATKQVGGAMGERGRKRGEREREQGAGSQRALEAF